MASITTTPNTTKKLGQFLEEQQEPFILEIYLSERGCINSTTTKKKLNSGRFLKRSVCLNNTIKAACNKLASVKDRRPQIKNNNDSQEAKEADCTTSDFNSCSESNFHLQKDDNLRISKNEAASVLLQEESEQISPVSVLQEDNQSRSSIALAKKITEDSLLPASLCKFVFQSAKDKQCCVGAAAAEAELEELPNSQFYRSRKILQQTNQLLFDCVREVLKERRQQNCKELMGPELLGKLMSDKIKAWGKQSGDELNITGLLDFDFQDSVQEWTDFQPQMRDVACEIGDAILEDIRDQIVEDM